MVLTTEAVSSTVKRKPLNYRHKKRQALMDSPFLYVNCLNKLESYDVCCLQAFLTLLHFKLNALAFSE